VSTTLRVGTSSSVTHYGLVVFDLIGPGCVLMVFVAFSLVGWNTRKLQPVRGLLWSVSATLLLACALALGGCGGYSNGMPTNRGTVSVVLTAQSGAISHTTTVSVSVQ
jgi:hypothetical protein